MFNLEELVLFLQLDEYMMCIYHVAMTNCMGSISGLGGLHFIQFRKLSMHIYKVDSCSTSARPDILEKMDACQVVSSSTYSLLLTTTSITSEGWEICVTRAHIHPLFDCDQVLSFAIVSMLRTHHHARLYLLHIMVQL